MNPIERARELFGEVPRPEHFTNHRHCCECAEHDETLQNRNPDTISRDDLSAAWDPMCFATNEAFLYYFPGLVRLAVEGKGQDYFIDQFVFHLTYDGRENNRWESFSPSQREFVVELLEYLVETRTAEIDEYGDTDGILGAIDIWSDRGRAQQDGAGDRNT